MSKIEPNMPDLHAATHGAGGSDPLSSAVAFPVGSVFIAVVSTNPATLLGYGTWAAIAAGKMLIGLNSGDVDFDTPEETGGAKITTAVINHTHKLSTILRSATTGGDTTQVARTSDTSSTADAVLETDAPAGGVASASIMNPFFVVYMWKRTA